MRRLVDLELVVMVVVVAIVHLMDLLLQAVDMVVDIINMVELLDLVVVLEMERQLIQALPLQVLVVQEFLMKFLPIMDGDILEVLPNHMDQVILTDQDLLELVAVVEQDRLDLQQQILVVVVVMVDLVLLQLS